MTTTITTTKRPTLPPDIISLPAPSTCAVEDALFQIATKTIARESHKKLRVNVLIDIGSKASYISHEVAKCMRVSTRMAHVKTAKGMTNRALPKLYPLGVWHDLIEKSASERNKKDEIQGEL